MSNVRISELNQLTIWTGDDFFPVVDSGSLTTYRTPISTILPFVAQSGSVVSSSWASQSLSSLYASSSNNSVFAVSSSWASQSFSALYATSSATSSLLLGVASGSINPGVSFYGTSSWALNIPGGNMVIAGGSYDISSSWASSSLSSSVAISASYASTASFVYSASYARSASWADRSLTASYVDVNSILGSIPGLPKAWAICACTASHPDSALSSAYVGKNWNNYAILSGYNVTSVKRAINNSGQGVRPVWDTSVYGPGQDFTGNSTNQHWIVTLTTPLPSTNYTVVGGAGAEQGGAEWSIFTMFPFAKRTTTQFTMSISQGATEWNDSGERNWFSFMVLSNP